MFTLHNGDCLEYMKSLPSESVDCIITDPPYKVTITKKSKMVNNIGNKRTQLEDLKNHDWSLPIDWILEANRIMKEGGAFYAWCCPEEMTILHRGMKASGFQVLSNLVWVKTTCMLAHHKKVYRNGCEFAVYGSKGKSIKYFREDVTQQELLPVWYEAPARSSSIQRTSHPAQKPIGIHKTWVENSTRVGDVIFDPFMGSGTTGVAAVELGRSFIGCELKAEYFAIAESRIKSAVFQPSFFTPSNNRLQPTAFGVGTQAEFPLLGGSQADELPATIGGG